MMKNFFVQFTKIILIGFTLMICLEILIRKIPNSYTNKLNIIEQNKNDVELLIMGTSHAHNGINPNLFPIKALNLSLGGQGITIDEFLLECYIDQMPKLKNVILPVDYQTLFMFDAYGSTDRYMYYNIYYNFEPKLFSLDSYEIFHQNSVKSKLGSLLHNNLTLHDDSLGFSPNDKIMDIKALETSAEETVKWQTVKNFSNDTINKNLLALSKIAEITNKNDVNLIIITIPVHKFFYELSDTMQMDFSRTAIQNILTTHKNCMYLDYYTTYFDDSCYCDATHLNSKGSELFTKILLHDLDSLNLFVR